MKKIFYKLKAPFIFLLTLIFTFLLATPVSALPFTPYAVGVSSATNSSVNGWSMQNTKFVVSGLFDGIGGADLAAVYDYGNNNMGIILLPEGNVSQARTIYLTGAHNWDMQKTKFVTAGDYDGDLISDIAILYDYGNNDLGIWVFSGGVSPSLYYKSGPNNWNLGSTKFVASGNYDGGSPATTDITVMYDYGNNKMGIWNFLSSGSSFLPELNYYSNSWNITSTKFFLSYDFLGDGYNDIAAVYDYGNNDMAIWVFDADPRGNRYIPSIYFRSGTGNWSLKNTKFATIGVVPMITMVYDYGNNNMGIWNFYNLAPGSFTPALGYISGSGHWSVENTKYFYDGLFLNVDSPLGAAAFYDYGNSTIGIWKFSYALSGPPL
ncbi:MAG: hypothetical protein M1355_01255 [Patescibacteria group bacterium]|nr:hypothetical protein [Patescibacteria group bacterium]